MGDIEIRPACVSDVPDIRRVARRSWFDSYADFLSTTVIEAELSTWYTPDAVETAVTDPTRPYFVAVDGDIVVGYSKGVADTPVADLSTLYVSPDCQHGGVGTRLLEIVSDELESRGATTLELTVFAENDGAIGFYEARGFERVGEQISELEAGSAPEYVYRTELDP
ncbi:GNAT family N-acetyltransferase [Haladaptatus paucihalophilus]|uniref:Ribosomal protein S18 acetylase RimI n=1 Tax=Haladaptatus paucihalophilus DX253 TaxID=797209 RepID=A0A1M6UEC4_HALPU|nr:GNAT family N-acetyltransferase [Haladaptatus paucihalophilus]SHK67527.1 Ribosomal protein S18 acetylase RimI [Haladaptatus paucihalophilus DX253]